MLQALNSVLRWAPFPRRHFHPSSLGFHITGVAQEWWFLSCFPTKSCQLSTPNGPSVPPFPAPVSDSCSLLDWITLWNRLVSSHFPATPDGFTPVLLRIFVCPLLSYLGCSSQPLVLILYYFSLLRAYPGISHFSLLIIFLPSPQRKLRLLTYIQMFAFLLTPTQSLSIC